VEITLPQDGPVVGHTVGEVQLPEDTALVAILREGRLVVPSADVPLEAGDELLAVTSSAAGEAQLGKVLGAS